MIKKTAGFTLIELLVVISIIGVLMAISLFGLQGAKESSRDARRKADIEMIRGGLEIYKSDCNIYPPSLTGGGSLTGDCPTTNTYISLIPLDPLGHSYSYTHTDTTYTLCTTLEQTGAAYCVSNP